MLFFNDCKTEKEAKSIFRKLSMHFHPDKGGDMDLMVELQNQYKSWNPNQFYEKNFSFKDTKIERSVEQALRQGYVYEKQIIELKRQIESLNNQRIFDIQCIQKQVREIQQNYLEIEKLKLNLKNLEFENESLKNMPLLKRIFNFKGCSQ